MAVFTVTKRRNGKSGWGPRGGHPGSPGCADCCQQGRRADLFGGCRLQNGRQPGDFALDQIAKCFWSAAVWLCDFGTEIGEPFLVTTGRRLRDDGWPSVVDTVVVMLDGGAAFQSLAPEGVHIWWGAYLGMPDEILMSGELSEVGPKIVAAREQARDKHGWIMDSYIIKRDRSRS